MKRILITGKNSYIGESVRRYLLQAPNAYSVNMVDTFGLNPTADLFCSYDTVFNVAGIAHIKETKANRHLYYDVNRDLAINIAKEAKKAGVKHLILLSSMSVYGLTIGHITKNTPTNANSSYGDSKAQADEEIKKLEDNDFIFSCLRPPMVYGRGCKGNYQALRKVALTSPVFPDYNNQKSMIYIGNLCEFIKQVIDERKGGLFFPQNEDYVNTSEMVKKIAENNHKRIRMTGVFNALISALHLDTVEKVFGNLTYEKVDTIDKYTFDESIKLTER